MQDLSTITTSEKTYPYLRRVEMKLQRVEMKLLLVVVTQKKCNLKSY